MRHAWEKLVDGAWVADDDAARDDFSRTTVDADGVVRWKTNGAVPPDDCLQQWARIGMEFDLDASTKASKADLEEFAAAYRAVQASRPVSSEELFEMRAAFGPGVEVVDVVSGRRTKL